MKWALTVPAPEYWKTGILSDVDSVFAGEQPMRGPGPPSTGLNHNKLTPVLRNKADRWRLIQRGYVWIRAGGHCIRASVDAPNWDGNGVWGEEMLMASREGLPEWWGKSLISTHGWRWDPWGPLRGHGPSAPDGPTGNRIHSFFVSS